jgi:hypothetical protein
MLDCVQRQGLARTGNKTKNAIQIQYFMHIHCKEERISASFATETAQNARSKTGKPCIFNNAIRKNRACIRGFSNRNGKNSVAHVPNQEKYQTKPFTVHVEPLSDDKQKS